MAADFQSPKLTQPVAGGPFREELVDAVHVSAGPADAGKLVVLNSAGVLDPSMGGGGGSTGFNDITSGTNLSATMTVGTGASITFTGSGAVNASEWNGTPITGSPTIGKIPIGQGTTAVWADPVVQGVYADGANVATPGSAGNLSTIQPVLVAGKGADGNMHSLSTDNSGQINIANFPAIQPVSGTVSISGSVAVTQSTSPWVTSFSAPQHVIVDSATLGTITITGGLGQNTQTGSSYTGYEGVLVAQANTANPVWTDGKLVPLSVDTSGILRVNATGGGGTQYADGTTQSTPTGTVALGKDATNVLHALKLDGSQNLDVNVQSAVNSAADGALLPASTLWIGASDGTDIRGLLVESSSNKNLRIAIYQGGNEVNVSSNRLLVDPTGTTIAVTNTGTFATQDSQLVAQGSTTSGQKGPLVQGAVTTNAPSYTTAQTSPLSITTSGFLRTILDAEASANGSTAVPTNAVFIGIKGADGFLHGVKSSTNDGAVDVNATFSGTVTPGFVTDITQSGSITSTQNVTLTTGGAASVLFNITGSWTGTISFEASVDGTNWVPATCYAKYPGGAGVTSATANGQWTLPVGGLNSFRVRGNTVASGTASVWIEKGAGGLAFESVQVTAANLNMTAVQGNAGSIAQSWFTKVTDGSNVLGTSANPFVITGNKTNNNAAPGATNIGALVALANSAAPSFTDGDQVLLSVDTSGALRVSSSGTFTPALTADITSTGTITNTQNVTLSTQGTGAVQFNVTGTWTGTLVFEASIDGTNFVAIKCLPRYPTTFPEASSTTVNGNWAVSTGGLNKFRVRGNTVASGTATIWIEGGAGAQDIQTLSMIFDPSSGASAAVKAASTSPVAADQALVVALSPNSDQFATSTTANALPGVNPVAVSTSSVAILNSNASRKEAIIINTGTTVIYLGLGQTPTTTAYHIVLGACTLANDGTGGTFTTDMFKGAINAIGSAGGGTVCVTELT